MENLFYLSINEDYYKPIIANSTVNSNYILSIKEYLNMIRPYLSNKINNHKTRGE